ncbi:right-handed parallel beta-helix repeat-containing protein [Roseimicrobium sp. ORNL1]|uniref:protein kinase domain-containing protein n=1 Tax=Roseimicrobium sp. ORNL1 TaxID=2711231 RepID=UPI0013E1A947|nr:right-handed parallel beta-helix repeat-containing protein [Roseimicrobium sp. ORNL1]QIF05070.1 protein kinase [Roseimicrobium sp. ORNL1]
MPDPKKPINLDDIDFGSTLRGHQKGDRVFDRFLLEKLLGRGGMGVVWLGTDERLGREVALKFAPEAVRYDDVAVDELKEETKKGLNLAHQNIVKIYDFLVDETHAAISMEFIDGENLGALRTRQPNKVFEVRQIAMWVGQFLDALDYAHRIAKVIHRDLKPANLMIDREGNLRVTDFGIARSISDAMNRATLGIGNSTGTLAYMSPQQADGKKPHVTDDLYAFGSTLYELLTGKPPFFTGNIISQLQHDPVTSLTERREEFGITDGEPIPVEWEQTILACLEKTPENRPASALAVRQRLGLAPACQPEVPPLPAVPGGSAAAGGSPTNFSHSAAHLPTGHGPTQTYVRPGAGLTEMSLPNRPIGAGHIKVGPGVTPVQPPTSSTQHHTTTQPAKKGGGILVAVGLVFLFFVLALVGGGWWVWNKTPYLKKLLGKEVAVSPLLDNPTPTPTPPGPGPAPTPTPPPTPPGPGPAPTPTPTPTPPGPGPAPTPTPTPPKVTSVQAMIDAAKSGDTVTVPEGIYEEQLKFKAGITLKAAVPGKVTVQTDGKSGAVLMVENCGSGSISGFVFQHTGTEITEKVNWPVALVKASTIVMDGCTIQAGLGDGLLVTGAGKSQFTKCIIRNNTTNGAIFESGASGSMSETEVRKNGESGVEVRFLGTAPVFSRCTFADNGLAGLIAKDGGSATVQDQTKVTKNGDPGIAGVGEGVTINVNGTELQGNTIGIAVMEGAKAKIQECIITESQQAGIQAQAPAAGSEFLNNTVQSGKLDGLLATGTSGTAITITGNKIKGNGGHGILIFGAGFKPKVEQNEISTNAGYGILAAEGVSGSVTDNTARGNHLGGVKNEGAGADIVIQGNLADESK